MFELVNAFFCGASLIMMLVALALEENQIMAVSLIISIFSGLFALGVL